MHSDTAHRKVHKNTVDGISEALKSKSFSYKLRSAYVTARSDI